MWVLPMINLPTLVLAFLYAVSWIEEWQFFFLLTTCFSAASTRRYFPRACLAMTWQGCAVALGDGSPGAALVLGLAVALQVSPAWRRDSTTLPS